MPATRSQTMPASRRTIGAALGLVLVVAAAPFLRSASAAQPTTDATATIETTPAAASVPTVDPAVWVNPVDPTKSLILGANNEDGLGVYDLTGAKQSQAGVATALMTAVDTRNNVTVACVPLTLILASKVCIQLLPIVPVTPLDFRKPP